MPVSQELLEILVCPETKQPVAPASDEVLQKINREIESGKLRNRGGEPVSAAVALGNFCISTCSKPASENPRSR